MKSFSLQFKMHCRTIITQTWLSLIVLKAEYFVTVLCRPLTQTRNIVTGNRFTYPPCGRNVEIISCDTISIHVWLSFVNTSNIVLRVPEKASPTNFVPSHGFCFEEALLQPLATAYKNKTRQNKKVGSFDEIML